MAARMVRRLRVWCAQAACIAPRSHAHCAVSWSAVCRVAGRGGRVAGPLRPYRRYAARRVAMPPRVSLRTVSQLLRCITTQCCRIATQGRPPPPPPPPPHDTNLCIVTLLPAKRTARRVGRAPGRIAGLLAVLWRSSGRIVACCAVSWRAPTLCLPA